MPAPQNFDDLTDYEVRHLLAHFVACDRLSAVHAILKCEGDDGLNAWYVRRTRTGTDADFQRDIDLANRIADADRSSALVLKTRYQMISSSLSSIHGRFPPSFVAELVNKGVWSARQALETVDFLTDGNSRASLLETILPRIPSDYRGRLLDLAHTLPVTGKEMNFEPDDYPDIVATSPKAEVLAQLSARYQGLKAEAIAEEAIATALQINDKRDRARCLGRLLSYLPSNQQLTAADLILKIADAETNPDRVFLTLPVLKILPHYADGIRPRIAAIADTKSGYYPKQALRYLVQFFEAILLSAPEVIREAMDIATRRTAKTSARGLLQALTSGDLDPGLISEFVSRFPPRALKAQEWEWLPLFVALAKIDSRTVEPRLDALRYMAHRIEFYLRVRQTLDPKVDRRLADQFAEALPEVTSLDERVRLAAGLLKTGVLTPPKQRSLQSSGTESAGQIRNPPPRFSALLKIVDAAPGHTPAVDLLIATINQLPGKTAQADAWLECASLSESCPDLARHDPWTKAKDLLRKISPQKDKSKLMARLFKFRPASCVGELRSDLFALEPEYRVMTIVKSMPSFDLQQKAQASRWLVEMVERTSDSSTQQMILRRSADCLEAEALAHLVRLFRSRSEAGDPYGWLARIAAAAPTTLIPIYVDCLSKKRRGARLSKDAVEPIERWLSDEDARRVYKATQPGSSPETQAEVFRVLSSKLPSTDHGAALERALQSSQRLVKISTLASVIDGLMGDVLLQYHQAIEKSVPEATNGLHDHSRDPLFFALSNNFARHGDMVMAFEYLAMSRSQEEHLVGIARHVAADEDAWRHILKISRDVFNLDGRARIQTALLIWRAKLGFVRDAFQEILRLDSHCMPIALNGLAAWLDEGQILEVLHLVKASPKAYITRPKAAHVWRDEDQKSIATYTTSVGGYFAPTPKEAPSASKLVPPLLPRLVALGIEETAWSLVHYAQSDGQVANFVTASTSHFSEMGLTQAIDLALSISTGPEWIVAVTALSIECATRGLHDRTEQLVALLPKRIAESTHYYRNRGVGSLVRNQLRIVRPANELLPAELTEEIAPETMAHFPRLAALVCCMASSAINVTHERVRDLFGQISEVSDGKLEAAVVEHLVSRTGTIATSTLRHIVEEALSGPRRPSGNAFAVVANLAPAIARLDGEQSVVEMYESVKQVCRWWN